MKKFLLFILAICMICSVASAEIDISGLTLEELMALRSEVSSRIVELCKDQEPEIPEGSLGTIAELFPDEPFAMAVRDELGKLSISQPVTQDELDKVTRITVGSSNSFGEIKSIVGIGHLRNLESLSLVNGAAEGLSVLPDEFYTLSSLRYVNLHRNSITEISPLIGNLTSLRTFAISGSEITGLPDELVNCVSLEELDISYSDITEVPAVLFAMPNVKVSMEGTNVK